MAEPEVITTLDAKAIFEADDLKVERVAVPEWGGHVHVRAITADERDAFEGSLAKDDGMVNARGRLMALTICDEKGKRLFRDDDAGQLGTKSGKAADRVVNKARGLAGLTAQDLEESRKN